MELTSIPQHPSREQLVVLKALLPEDGVCRACGTWSCADCGVLTAHRNRFFPGPHHCRTCKGQNGQMLATRHRVGRDLEHYIIFLRMVVDGDALRYPVVTPLPPEATALIDRLRSPRRSHIPDPCHSRSTSQTGSS